eukprot:3490209-Alexandrium_andersonii.AAC.1
MHRGCYACTPHVLNDIPNYHGMQALGMASCAHSPVSPASSQWSVSVTSEMDSSSESSYARSYFVWKRCLKMASPKAL